MKKIAAIIFITLTCATAATGIYLAVTGVHLPGPGDKVQLSLKDGSRGNRSRRAHYYHGGRYYGK